MPLLPPRFIVSIPTALVFCAKIYPAIVLTWLQLRCLAGEGRQTPALTYKQAGRLFGKSRSTMYGHLDLLRRYGVLQITAADGGLFIASFEAVEALPTTLIGDASPSQDRGPDSLSPVESELTTGQAPPAVNPESRIQDSALILNTNVNIDLRIKELREEAESKFQDSGKDLAEEELPPEAESEPARIYRQVTHLSPKPAQRQLLTHLVLDLEAWRQTIEHWTLHAWNPLNLAGMLELYQRGGPPNCRVCHPETNPGAPGVTPAAAGNALAGPGEKTGRKPPVGIRQQRSLQALADLRKETGHGDPR